ncbi:mitochondrial ribosomal protein MRP51 [Camillea tinctor]|nr:mitochondrial ribosomal protein MRP51 [Camillea tinctor]
MSGATVSGATVSPGAALLRSSRMFSMPAPIPGPSGNFANATKHYNASATTNFPTHLSVTTPATSRMTGDWGFKRPLPLRTTLKSTIPLIRVKQVDSIEHVTDFVSASDHTITLKKYQEMHLPISVPPEDPRASREATISPKSVFEEDGDVLAFDQDQAIELETKRWRFKGPWLAGMTDGDFNKYLEKTVRTRRSEFRAYLKEHLATTLTNKGQRSVLEKGTGETSETVTAESITDEQLMEELKRLREERTELYTHVSRFLDLAPVTTELALMGLGRMAPGQSRNVTKGSPYSYTGPPITHPSAGISYLRTRNFLENHPIYGPQLNHAPVKARVLMPRNMAVAHFFPSFGLAGFVPETPYGDTVFNNRASFASKPKPGDKHLHQFDLEQRGGSKIYLEPSYATIGPNGVIKIIATDPHKSMATLIAKEMIGEDGADVYGAHKKGIKRSEVPRSPSTRPIVRTYAEGGSATYGMGFEDLTRGT